MRRYLPTFLIIILVLAIYPFVGMDRSSSPKLTGLPWQIEILPDGHSKVFGLVPGVSSLQDAVTALGRDFDLAIVENETSASLEMYFSDYRVGMMTARMVLAASSNAADLRQWQQRAVKVEPMGSGKARKYLLADGDREVALHSPIRAIAFIPAVNLDDEILRKRFGEPAEKVDAEPGVSYYLYPEKGLAITLSAESKEVLQYVAPADFTSLRAPLRAN